MATKTVSLKRIPLLIAVIVAVVTLIGSALIGWRLISLQADNRASLRQLQAEHLAEQLAGQLQIWQAGLRQFALSDGLIPLFEGGDAGALNRFEYQAQRYFPEAWRLRLIPPGLTDTDSSLSPPISYADLDALRFAESTGKAPPVVAEGIGSESARLILAQPVVRAVGDPLGEQPAAVVGHLLLSVRLDWLSNRVRQLSVDQGLLQLQQPRKKGEPQIVASVGDSGLAAAAALHNFAVAGSDWQVAYWQGEQVAATDRMVLIYLAVIALVMVLSVAGAGFFLSRGFGQALHADMATLVTMVRDMRSGGLQDRYPVHSAEAEGAIHTLREELAQLRRKKPAKPAAKPAAGKSAPKTPPVKAKVDDTPDIDLDLE